MALLERHSVHPQESRQTVRLAPVRLPYSKTRDAWGELRERVCGSPQTGATINLPWMNEEGHIDERFQRVAADTIRAAFAGDAPTVVLGIGNSGTPLSEVVAWSFWEWGNPAEHRIVRKLSPRTTVRNPVGVFFANSFTEPGTTNTYRAPRLEPDSRVLIINDFAGQGDEAIALAEFYERDRVEVVGLGVYCSEDEQGGLEAFTKRTGAPSFAAVRVRESRGGSLYLPYRDTALTRFERGHYTHHDTAPIDKGTETIWRFPTDDAQVR